MKRKLGLLLFVLSCVFLVVSCEGSQEVTKKEIEVIEVVSDLSSLYEEVSKSCVGVLTSTEFSDIGTGSGVIYKLENNNYYVVTNHHVIDGGTKFQIYFGNNKYVKAQLIGSDPNVDIAVLRFTVNVYGIDIKPLDIFSQIDVIKPGQSCFSIGSPLGFDNFNYLTDGVIGLQLANKDVLHSAHINPGNSGGGLFNYSGRLIGINVSKSYDKVENDGKVVSIEGMGRAIGMDRVRRTISTIEKNGGTLSQPTIGIKAVMAIRNISEPALVNLLPATLDFGIIVKEVIPGSPADNAGFKVDDILYSADGEVLTHIDTIATYILQKYYYGDKFEVTLIRYNASLGKYETIAVEVVLTVFNS